MSKPPRRPLPPTYAVDLTVTTTAQPFDRSGRGPDFRAFDPKPKITTTFQYRGQTVLALVGHEATVYATGDPNAAAGFAVVDEMVRRANAHDGLVRALTALDAWIESLMADPVHPDQEAYGFDIMRARIAAALDVELPAVSGCTES